MDPRFLMRAKRWVQNPPSWQRVLLVFGVIAACGGIWAAEAIYGWPDWLEPNDLRRLRP